MHEVGFRGAWLVFRETLPDAAETPDIYLLRLAVAIRAETGERDRIYQPDWASFMTGIDRLLFVLERA